MITDLTVGDGTAKKLNETSFGGQVAKFKGKRAKKTKHTFFRAKKIILSKIYDWVFVIYVMYSYSS